MYINPEYSITAASSSTEVADDEKRELLATQIARDLHGQILDGRLRPGQRLPQQTLAQRYGASRVPVQQALQGLAVAGLVTLSPNAGARVAPFDLSELVAVYHAREAIEPMVLRQSVPNLTAADVTELAELVVTTERCADSGDIAGYVEADRPLHMAMFRKSAMPRLFRMIEGFWDTTQLYRGIYGQFPSAIATSVIEHRLLLDLIVSANAEDAGGLLAIHIRRTRLALESWVDGNNGARSSGPGRGVA